MHGSSVATELCRKGAWSWGVALVQPRSAREVASGSAFLFMAQHLIKKYAGLMVPKPDVSRWRTNIREAAT
jgi:hypothetical protein